MNRQTGDDLHALQIAFIGKLMAGVSHEFKNHLAVIKELNGLLGDLLSAEKSGSTANIDRYKKIVSDVEGRIGQAAIMCRYLSGFSHRMDQPLSMFPIPDAFREALYLLERFAMQRRVALDYFFVDSLPSIYNNPSLLQFAFFCIVQPVLEQMNNGGEIRVSASPEGKAVKIVIRFEGAGLSLENIGHSHLSKLLPEVLQTLGSEFSSQSIQNEVQETALLLRSVAEPET